MSTENTEVTTTGDEMLDAYLEQYDMPTTQKTEQEIAADEEEKQKIEQEEQARLKQEEDDKKSKEEEAELEKKKQADVQAQQQEKPKRWDEGLDAHAKFVLDKLSKGEDKEVYELLKNKFGYENLSEEDKVMTYLAEKNPHLDREDLLFKAANEYGIGVEATAEEDLTDTQKTELKRQAIERKGLISQANDYFKEKAVNVTIPELPNPLDDDEGYKEYQDFKKGQETALKEQQEQEEKQKKEIEQLEINVNTTAKQIEVLPIELKISLDQGEFDLKTDFKLDEAKQKQLADYVLDYSPTQAEIKAHQNQNGELDMKGYMTTLAERLFSKQIIKNAVKVAISKDREEFTERELKNSTLRNTSESGFNHDEPFDIFTEAMGR